MNAPYVRCFLIAGALIGPFFIIYFTDLYGVRGAFIIIAGLWMQVIVIGALQRPSPRRNIVHSDKEEPNNVDNNIEIFWESDKSGKSTITISDEKCVELDVKCECEKKQTVKPSYISLLKRPKVWRALTIVFLGITGSLGK